MLKVFCTLMLVKKKSILVPLVLKKCGKYIDSSDGLFGLTCLDFHTRYTKNTGMTEKQIFPGASELKM